MPSEFSPPARFGWSDTEARKALGSAERILEHDGFGARRADRDERQRYASELFDAAQVATGGHGQRVEIAQLAQALVPALELLVDRLRAAQLAELAGEL